MTFAFAAIALVMLYTTAVNVVERPDGVQIGAAFIIAILAVSLVSRILPGLRAAQPGGGTRRDGTTCDRGPLAARDPDHRARAGQQGRRRLSAKIEQIVADNDLPNPYDLIFLEVTVTDPSDFESRLEVRGTTQHKKYRVLEVESPSVPNAIAAVLLHIRDVSGVRPHIYFEWTEGNPLGNLVKFLAVRHGRGGAGDARGTPAGGAEAQGAAPRPCGLSAPIQG